MIGAGRIGLLGLGLRAGKVVVGTGGVRDGLQRGDFLLVIVASDRSSRTDEKVSRLAEARGVPLLEGPSATELGQRLGRETVQAVGVTDPHLAAGLQGSDRQADEEDE